MQNLPNGAKVLLVKGKDGLCYQTGIAQLPNGQTCQCGTVNNWVPSAPNRYNPSKFALLSPDAAAQMAQQGSPMGNTFTALDLPNRGAVGVARKEGNASPVDGALFYQIILDNTNGATPARQFLGDYTGTYALLGNAEATPVGFVIGGTWSTNSKTQFAGRTAFRPWRVSKIQFIASNEAFFNETQSFYFDTKPVSNAPVKDSLTLTTLLDASQYNPKIQWFDKSVRFDGINGLDITIPAGQKVTLQMSIVSEASAGDQVIL